MTPIPLFIFGASGHGKVILDMVEKQGMYAMAGWVDSHRPKGSLVKGYPVLGSEDDLRGLRDLHPDAQLFIAIGDNHVRRLVRDRILERVPGIAFATVVHPAAQVARDVHIGIGAAIMPGAVVNSDAFVGEFSIVNTNACLEHDGWLGDFSSLAAGVTVGGGVRIGMTTAVCIGATLRHGITVGDHCVVAPGAVVTSDCADRSVMSGVPAVCTGFRAVGDPYL